MRQWLRSHLTYANVMVTILAFIVLGGMSYAATGGNFILGQSNSASSTTSLTRTGANTGKGLQVTNNSTTAGATALGLNVASGHAPFTVNSGTKVANLNADKLDGVDSGGFVRGRGTFLANRLVFNPTNSKTLLTIPGLGYLQASCNSNDTDLTWWNDTGGNVDMWWDSTNSHFDSTVMTNTNGNGDLLSRVSNRDGVTLALGVGNDPGPRRTAVLHAFAYQSGDGAPCGFQVQGTLWTSQ